MKKILIVSHTLNIGGAERALLGLLNSLDFQKCSVDLFLMRHEGELLNQIPVGVNLLPELPQYASLATPIENVIHKRKFGVAIGRVIGKFLALRYVKKHNISADNGVELEYSHKYTRIFMPKISDEIYDMAISFLTPHYFVAEKVNALKKIAWIHTDYKKVAVNVTSELAMWNKYDRIVAISNSAKTAFESVFPSLSPKVAVIENILSKELIMQFATAENVESRMSKDGSIKILSIGRFCTAKNFDNIPDICARIRAVGLDVKWYIIGFGSDEDLIKRKIIEFGMQNYVIILGKTDNPYPYIKACDLYVQPSRYEGKCVSVCEAQMLGKPVVITNYTTSGSQLEDGVDGIIVPMDNEGCSDGIIELLHDSELMKKISENCIKRDYTNSTEIKKIYEMMES